MRTDTKFIVRPIRDSKPDFGSFLEGQKAAAALRTAEMDVHLRRCATVAIGGVLITAAMLVGLLRMKESLISQIARDDANFEKVALVQK